MTVSVDLRGGDWLDDNRVELGRTRPGAPRLGLLRPGAPAPWRGGARPHRAGGHRPAVSRRTRRRARAAPAVPLRIRHALAREPRGDRGRPRLLPSGGRGGATHGRRARRRRSRPLRRGQRVRRAAHPARARVVRPRVHDVGHDRLAPGCRGVGAHRRVVPEAGRPPLLRRRTSGRLRVRRRRRARAGCRDSRSRTPSPMRSSSTTPATTPTAMRGSSMPRRGSGCIRSTR